MTSLSQANAKRFDGHRDDCTAAIKRANDQRREAMKIGDTARATELTERRSRLRQSLQDIDEAEEAWLRSTLTVAEAEARLKASRVRASNAVQAMRDIASAIQKSTELINLFASLPGLFR
jgi:hypothetical protein